MKSFIFCVTIFCTIVSVCSQRYTFIKFLEKGTCGQATAGPIVQRISSRLSYTGGFLWSDSGVKLCFIDRYAPAMGRYTAQDGRFFHQLLGQGSESVLISPVYNGTSATRLLFIIGVDNTLILSSVGGTVDKVISTERKLLTVSNKPERFMRGRCDDKGRLWYVSTGVGDGNKGTLYKIENLATPIVMEDDLIGGAGMAWTADYKTFYLVDSTRGLIYKYDFDSKQGIISNRMIIFRIKNQPNLIGVPFDLAVDTNGYLWISMLQGGAVIQYDVASESVIRSIAIPAADAVSLAFGGLDKTILYVGTARNPRDTESGSIFAISGLGATGLADNNIIIPDQYTN